MQIKVEMVKRTMAIPMAERPWTASAVHAELRDVNGLIRNLRNARARSDQQLDGIASSITFGYTNPIWVDRHGMIIAGHAPLLGARWLPVIFTKRSSKS